MCRRSDSLPAEETLPAALMCDVVCCMCGVASTPTYSQDTASDTSSLVTLVRAISAQLWCSHPRHHDHWHDHLCHATSQDSQPHHQIKARWVQVPQWALSQTKVGSTPSLTHFSGQSNPSQATAIVAGTGMAPQPFVELHGHMRHDVGP